MIREATSTDLDRMLEIGQAVTLDNSKLAEPEYAARIQLRGFIPEGFATEENFKEELEERDVALVYENDSEICGFCTARKEIYYPEDLDAVIWVDGEAKKRYFHSKESTVITYLLLDPPSRLQGIGTELFQECVSMLREKDLTDIFWITTLSPLANLASMAFISKQGFMRANFTMPSDMFGLKNQQSVLFWRSYD